MWRKCRCLCDTSCLNASSGALRLVTKTGHFLGPTMGYTPIVGTSNGTGWTCYTKQIQIMHIIMFGILFMIIQNDNMNDPIITCSFLIITCSHVSHAIGLFSACILAAEVSLECCVCNAGEDIVFRATKVMEISKCSKGCPCKLQTSDVASPGAYNSCIGISDLA